jgi:hypothetical protein
MGLIKCQSPSAGKPKKQGNLEKLLAVEMAEESFLRAIAYLPHGTLNLELREARVNRRAEDGSCAQSQ